MRTFVQSMMQGKVKDSVPQELARCGYKFGKPLIPKKSSRQQYAKAPTPVAWV